MIWISAKFSDNAIVKVKREGTRYNWSSADCFQFCYLEAARNELGSRRDYVSTGEHMFIHMLSSQSFILLSVFNAPPCCRNQ